MSREYPCVHFDGGKCKLSRDESFPFCVYGPCKDETPSNADRIRSMSDEELEDFLDKIAYYGRESPWSEKFSEEFCKNCQTTTYIVEGYSYPMEFSECDFSDEVCPHGRDIMWWLQQPAEEESHKT